MECRSHIHLVDVHACLAGQATSGHTSELCTLTTEKQSLSLHHVRSIFVLSWQQSESLASSSEAASHAQQASLLGACSQGQAAGHQIRTLRSRPRWRFILVLEYLVSMNHFVFRVLVSLGHVCGGAPETSHSMGRRNILLGIETRLQQRGWVPRACCLQTMHSWCA